MSNNVLIAKKDNISIIKILDKATMKNLAEVEKVLDSSSGDILIDLSSSSYIDSTFLGLIAKYTMIFKKKNNEYLKLVNPTENILIALKQTGILKFVEIVKDNFELDFVELLKEDMKKEDKATRIIELHEKLIDMNEDNRKVFGAVVEQMKKKDEE